MLPPCSVTGNAAGNKSQQNRQAPRSEPGGGEYLVRASLAVATRASEDVAAMQGTWLLQASWTAQSKKKKTANTFKFILESCINSNLNYIISPGETNNFHLKYEKTHMRHT
jgi:hypothetical protein